MVKHHISGDFSEAPILPETGPSFFHRAEAKASRTGPEGIQELTKAPRFATQ